MAGKIKNLPESFVDKKFGRLTIIREVEKIGYIRRVEAICECGIIKEYSLKHLLYGSTKSCGCYHVDSVVARSTTHGLLHTKLFHVWKTIIGRCYNKKHTGYKHYGLKGTGVCDEWRKSVVSFYNWAIDNGWKDGLTIDRYPNKTGNYEPNNCRIANYTQQARNKTNNIKLEFNGEIKLVIEWAEEYKIPYQLLHSRLKKGWGAERALLKQVGKKN